MYIDVHVGEVGIGNNHNNDFQSKFVNELDSLIYWMKPFNGKA